MTRPIDVVRKLCPRAKPSYVAAFENGDALFKKYGVTTPLRVAHFLAQCLHETGGLTIEWESGNYTAQRIGEIFGAGHHSAAITATEAQGLAHNGPALFERTYGLGNPRKARELGNTSPGDGFKYRGGGIMQTTGRGNYRRMGQKCGVDFETHPEYVLSAEHALKPALAEWGEGNLNAAADSDDILTITKRINGGTNGLADRREWLARIKPLVRVTTLNDTAPAPVEPAPVPAPPRVPASASVAPAPMPPPQPAPANTARNAALGTTILGAIAAALSNPRVEVIAAVVVIGIVAALVIHKFLPKKGAA